jgi:hypothetical protein
VIAIAGFMCDLIRSFTWRQFLLAQLLAVAFECIAVLAFVMPLHPPPSFAWSRVVIEQTMGLSIVLALLAANQAIARGARPIAAHAIAIVVASVAAALFQFQVRHWLHIYTNVDRPGIEISRRETQMIVVGSDTLIYGGLFMLMYVDYQRRERALRRIREAELDRARYEQRRVQSRLAAVRSSIDGEELMMQLADVQRLFEQNSEDADRRLDELVAALRAKVTQLDANRVATPA